jgi:hypothetical protein
MTTHSTSSTNMSEKIRDFSFITDPRDRHIRILLKTGYDAIEEYGPIMWEHLIKCNKLHPEGYCIKNDPLINAVLDKIVASDVPPEQVDTHACSFILSKLIHLAITSYDHVEMEYNDYLKSRKPLPADYDSMKGSDADESAPTPSSETVDTVTNDNNTSTEFAAEFAESAADSGKNDDSDNDSFTNYLSNYSPEQQIQMKNRTVALSAIISDNPLANESSEYTDEDIQLVYRRACIHRLFTCKNLSAAEQKVVDQINHDVNTYIESLPDDQYDEIHQIMGDVPDSEWYRKKSFHR